MSALEQQSDNSRLRSAMESGDLPAILDAFAPDAVFRSPLTDKLTFNGREQIGALTEVILEAFHDLRYTEEIGTGGDGFLVGRARVGGQEIEWVDHMRLDAEGRIRELTVFFRPLPASAAALRVIGIGLARRRSPARAAMISVFARPLGLMTRVGDGIGARLIGSVLAP